MIQNRTKFLFELCQGFLFLGISKNDRVVALAFKDINKLNVRLACGNCKDKKTP